MGGFPTTSVEAGLGFIRANGKLFCSFPSKALSLPYGMQPGKNASFPGSSHSHVSVVHATGHLKTAFYFLLHCVFVLVAANLQIATVLKRSSEPKSKAWLIL